MTAVEVRVDDAAAMCPLLTGRLPCVPCLRSWGIAAERLHAIACRALDRPPAHPRLSPSDQRQGLCFIRTMLSGWGYGATTATATRTRRP